MKGKIGFSLVQKLASLLLGLYPKAVSTFFNQGTSSGRGL
jgi:hypothetical protein